jgi:uncharacterized protein (DUF58 family)
MTRPGLGARMRRWLRPPRRLRFVREGKYFVAFSVAIGFGAVNTGNNLLYLILGWMLAVIVASGIMSEQTLRGLVVTRQPPPRIFAGRPFLMGISLRNGKRRLPSFSVEVEDLQGERPLDKRCYFLKVPAGRTQTTSYRHVFPRRGRQRLDGFRLSTRFPFAFFRKSRDVERPAEVIVYPAIHPVVPPPPAADRGGEEARARLGRRGEFFGLRELRQGDDVRDVHWRSSARQGRLVVKEYEEESHRRAVLLVDNALPDGAGEAEREALERSISLAGSLAAAYLSRGWAVRLVARGASVPAAVGPGQLDRLLRALALLEVVGPEAPWTGSPEPGAENLLVTPRPGQVTRPAGVTRVVGEAA